MTTTKYKDIDEAIKAFGGCELCYGKGYSTELSAQSGQVEVNTCTCDRGKQIDEMLTNMHATTVRTMMDAALEALPEYVEHHYPKGKSKERGAVTVHISEFLTEMKKAVGA